MCKPHKRIRASLSETEVLVRENDTDVQEIRNDERHSYNNRHRIDRSQSCPVGISRSTFDETGNERMQNRTFDMKTLVTMVTRSNKNQDEQELDTQNKKYFKTVSCFHGTDQQIIDLLGNVFTCVYMLYQLVLQSSTEPKHSVQRDLHLPRDQKRRITSKEMPGKHGYLDFLLDLQRIPNQIIRVLPVSLNSYFDSVTSGSSMSLSESMSNNLLRISSYSNFPRHVNIFTSSLSKAGFYYTGNLDEVRCYACGITHQKWKPGDNPIEIHRRLSPSCSHVNSLCATSEHLHGSSSNFLQETASCQPSAISNNQSTSSVLIANGPMNSNNSTSHNVVKQNNPITGTGHLANLNMNSSKSNPNISSPNEYTNSSHSHQDTFAQNSTPNHYQNGDTGHCETSNHCTASDLLPMDINVDKPRYPRYASLQVRISSYQGWPSYLDQTPRDMAQAGFLYAGYQDYTRCFFCGGGLRNWEAGDDPWVEHARWFKACAYLIQNKGDKFIKAVQEKQNQLEKEKNPSNSHNSLLQLPPALQNTDPSNISPRRNDQTNKHLDTVAARSVLEMGYSDDQVVQAIQQIMSSNPDGRTISATDIMSVLLEENNDEYRVRDRPESATVTSENKVRDRPESSVATVTSENRVRDRPESSVATVTSENRVRDRPESSVATVTSENRVRDRPESSVATVTSEHGISSSFNGGGNGISSSFNGTQNGSSQSCTGTQNGSSQSCTGTQNGISSSFNGTQNGSTDMALTLDDSNLDDAEFLVEENRQLKDQRLCKICLDFNASIAFLPCGHLVCCSECAPAMRKCPICRGHVKGTVKTFMV